MLQKMKNIAQRAKDLVANHIVITILAMLILIGAFTYISIEALHFSSDPSFCQRCHPLTQPGPLGEVWTWGKSAHAKAGVLCLNCHAEPGLYGYLRAKMGGLYDVYGEFIKGPEHKMHVLMSTSDPKYRAQLVKNDICMFCHTDSVNQKIRNRYIMYVGVQFRLIDSVVNPEFRKKFGLPDIITEGVRPTALVDPRHKKHLEMGFNCVDCHAKITHSGIAGYKTRMSICFECHDKVRSQDKKPPSDNDCLVCHQRKDGIVPEPISFGLGDSAVTFDHGPHTAILKCNQCHPQIFPTKIGSTIISFLDHGKPRFCFACHDGEKAFSWNNCTNCHSKVPFSKMAITYKPTGAAPVSFSHEFHTQVFECNKCHTKIWDMKKGSKKMTMAALYEGKFCGMCHNEKEAFPVTDCDKCHMEAKKKRK